MAELKHKRSGELPVETEFRLKQEHTFTPKKGLFLFILLMFTPASLLAQTAAFTYQGRLVDGGQSANGSYDMQFRLGDAATSGNYVAGPITNAPVLVSNGLFTVTLDFGASVFDGSARWLEIGVRTNGSGGPYMLLSPRQALTTTPYSTFAYASASAGIAVSLTPGALAGTGALTNGSTATNLTLVNPKFATSFDASNATNSNATLDSLPRAFGSEYLYHWFSLLRSNLPARVVFDGDSTTLGAGVNDWRYHLENLVPAMLGSNVPSALSWLNIAVSGVDVVYWSTIAATNELAQNPDLLIVRFGINGPNTGSVPNSNWEPAFRSALSTLRSARTLDQMSIVVMAPNSTDYEVAGHNAAYHQTIQPIIRRAARDYLCAFVDTYSFLKDSTNQATLWMDSLLTHPKEEMNLQIAGLLSDFIFPPSIRQFITGGNSTVSALPTNALTQTLLLYSRSADGSAPVTNSITIQNGLIMAWQQVVGAATVTNISDLALWLDAAAITNVDGTQVTTWTDRSTNGLNAVAANGGPAYQLTGLNNHPSLLFSATGNVMTITGPIAARPYSLFIVANYPQASAPLKAIFGNVASNFCYYFNANSQSDATITLWDGANNNRTLNGSLPIGTPFLGEMTHNASQAPSIYINGKTQVLQSSGALSGTKGFNDATTPIGGNSGNYLFPGQISEILVYRKVLSTGERLAVEAYLRTRWNLW
jgi:hypothetical protein